MSRQVWKGSTLLNPEPPVLVSCGPAGAPNLITVAGAAPSAPSPAWFPSVCGRNGTATIDQRKRRVCHQPADRKPGTRGGLVRRKNGRDVDKFSAMHLTPSPAAKVGTVLVEESPVNLECKVTQVIPLGSHDLFLAEVVAVDVDERLLDESGKLCLNKANLIVYSHGDYLALGRKLGSFGYSVRKKPRKK